MKQIDKELLERVIRYLDGDMEPDERQALEQRLPLDEALRQALDAAQHLIKGVQYAGTTQLAADIQAQLDRELPELEDFHAVPEARGISLAGAEAAQSPLATVMAEMEQEGFFEETHRKIQQEQTPAPGRRRWWIGLSAVLLLAVLGWWWHQQRQAEKRLALFHEQFGIPDPHLNCVLQELGVSAFSDPNLERKEGLKNALLLVNKNAFAEALPLLKQHTGRFPQDTTAALYLAVCQVAAGAPDVSMPVWEKLARQPNVAPVALWYQARAQIRLGRVSAARQTLERLQTLQTQTGRRPCQEAADSAYREQAGQLLKKLDAL